MFAPSFISFDPSQGGLNLRGLPILIDPDDFEGVHIAVRNLADDFHKVVGHKSEIWTRLPGRPATPGVILIGSLEKCRYLQELASRGHDFSSIDKKWESFEISLLNCPWSFADRILVIAGSDKRGAIFGAYTLSEQIGVSPWYFWADVAVQARESVYALPVTVQCGSPSVQYRGIFINDEAPALTDWVNENFGPKYNSEFYKKVFELLLRMKANFLWPAMWSGYPEPGNIFFLDDPLNQQLADIYGIVVSTSHHEPMQTNMSEWRLSGQGKWVWEENKTAITKFMTAGATRARPFESILTLGMRGDSDGEIEADDPQATLKDVIETQRGIIKDVYGGTDGVKQVMALYKEVQEYYESGLEIPEDVTLLFSDDNFGNIRRVPTQEERKRPGGAGVYYHLEYVGYPRSYKWLNSTSCGKMLQQLTAAHKYGASKIWVFNVGDIKPQELSLTFALSLAWNVNFITPTLIPRFFTSYAAREFGAEHAEEISELLLGHDRLMALRKHEHIEPETFSILNYREADRIVATYQDLERRANILLHRLPATQKASFFQIVLHPIKASRINTQLRVTQAKNKLYGLQRRNTTNILAKFALGLFESDFALSEQYHDNTWIGKKWNHILEQPHYGYSSETWHAPSRDVITGLSFVQTRQNSNRIVGQMGVAVEGKKGIRPGLINEESDRMQPSRGELTLGLTLPLLSRYGTKERYFEIFSRGTQVIEWTVSCEEAWVQFSQRKGRLRPKDQSDHRVEVILDWNQVPQSFQNVLHIDVRSAAGDYEQVHLPVRNTQVPDGFSGYVDSDGYVAIDVGSTTLSQEQQHCYQTLPYIGRTASGGIALLDEVPKCDHLFLNYPIFIFSSPESITISLYFTMVLESQPDEQPLLYDLAFDGTRLQSVPLLESTRRADLPVGWPSAVQDGVWIRTHSFANASAGAKEIRYRPLATGLILERIVVDLGGVRESYLGPPQSEFVGKQKSDIETNEGYHPHVLNAARL